MIYKDGRFKSLPAPIARAIGAKLPRTLNAVIRKDASSATSITTALTKNTIVRYRKAAQQSGTNTLTLMRAAMHAALPKIEKAAARMANGR